MILKLNLKTPGREDDDAETKLYTKADYKAKVDGNDADSENEMTPEDQKSALKCTVDGSASCAKKMF